MAFKKNFIIHFFFILAGLIFIYPLLQDNFFITDDFVWVNFAAEAKTINDIFAINWGSLYDTIINIYFFIAYQIFKLQPAGYYFFSLLLHIANTILLVLLISNFLKKNLFLFIIGLLFLLQYFSAEAFFWISSVTHLLATFWILLSLIFLNHYLSTQKKKFLFLNYLFALLALLTKEVAFPMLAVYFFWCLLFFKFKEKKIEYKRIFTVILPLLIIWLLYGLAQYFILHQSSTMSHYFAPSLHRQLDVISFSLANLIFYLPDRFNFYHLSALYLLLVVFAFYLRNKSLYLYLFGFSWILIYLIFCSLPVQESAINLIPHRYGYLASIGFIFIVTSLFFHARESKFKYFLAIVVILLIGYNYNGIQNLEKDAYQPMSDYSAGVVLTLPEVIRTKDLIYILDGYPYDGSNYLNISLGFYHQLDKEVILIYSDKRNNTSIAADQSYVVLRFDYSQKHWEIIEQN